VFWLKYYAIFIKELYGGMYGKVNVCYDMSRVAHYTIDMVSNLYDGYGIELCIGYGLILMVDVIVGL
jgi:hypothetical protein